MMKLTQTNSGNWAKEVTVTAGGKWSFVGNFGTLAAAESAAETQRAQGRKTEVTEEETSKNQEKKHRGFATNYREGVYVGPVEGKIFWRVEAYICRTRQVMQHASRAECILAGKDPGKMND